MKKIIFFMLLALSSACIPLNAQNFDKNIVKTNLVSPALRTFSLQYERLVSRKISVAVSGRYMPQGKIPMLNTLESYIDDAAAYQQLQDMQLGGMALTPEIRFYLGRKPGARGFYFAPFAIFSKYDVDFKDFEFIVPDQSPPYEETTHTVRLNGNIKGVSGGLMLGSQWKFGKMVYLDWWILGASYGTANGKLDARSSYPLDADEQRELKKSVDELEVRRVKIDSEVDANGIRATLKGPWAGFRGGLSLGIKF